MAPHDRKALRPHQARSARHRYARNRNRRHVWDAPEQHRRAHAAKLIPAHMRQLVGGRQSSHASRKNAQPSIARGFVAFAKERLQLPRQIPRKQRAALDHLAQRSSQAARASEACASVARNDRRRAGSMFPASRIASGVETRSVSRPWRASARSTEGSRFPASYSTREIFIGGFMSSLDQPLRARQNAFHLRIARGRKTQRARKSLKTVLPLDDAKNGRRSAAGER